MLKQFIIDRIRELCFQNGFELYGFSKASGISYNTLYSIMSGKVSPSVYTISDICDFFNISLSQFFSTVSECELPDDESKLLTLWRQLNEKEKFFVLGSIHSFLGLIPPQEENNDIQGTEKNRRNTYKSRRQYTV